MRIIRFLQAGQMQYGCLAGETISLIEGDIFGKFRLVDQQRLQLSEVVLQAPVQPPAILCIGKNYQAHAEEFKSEVPPAPVMFVKTINTLQAPGQPVHLPPRELTWQIDYEAELAVVIGKTAKNVAESEALEYVFGYTCANDVTARDWQRQDGQWARGKSLDDFCPLGPWIDTDLDPTDLEIEGVLNGQVMQSSRTSMMIFSVPYLISYLSRSMTLLPGTVLLTGTPAGCGFAREPKVFLKHNDVYEVKIQGIGTLSNKFVQPEN